MHYTIIPLLALAALIIALCAALVADWLYQRGYQVGYDAGRGAYARGYQDATDLVNRRRDAEEEGAALRHYAQGWADCEQHYTEEAGAVEQQGQHQQRTALAA